MEARIMNNREFWQRQAKDSVNDRFLREEVPSSSERTLQARAINRDVRLEEI